VAVAGGENGEQGWLERREGASFYGDEAGVEGKIEAKEREEGGVRGME